MLDIVSRFWPFLFFLIRPSVFMALICFVGGGVMTIKNEYVHDKMLVAAKIWDEVLQPDLEKGAVKISNIVKDEVTSE